MNKGTCPNASGDARKQAWLVLQSKEKLQVFAPVIGITLSAPSITEPKDGDTNSTSRTAVKKCKVNTILDGFVDYALFEKAQFDANINLLRQVMIMTEMIVSCIH